MLNPKKANKFALALIIYTIFLSFTLSLIIIKSGVNIEKAQLVLIVVQNIPALLLPILVYCGITRTKLNNIIPHERLSLKNGLYVTFLTILVSPIILVVSSVTSIFFPPEVNTDIYMYIIKLPAILAVFALAVMPAIFEELIFRGIILNNYKATGILKSAVISGLFFGLFHTNFYQMGYAIVAGLFFSFLVVYTNSLYASILSHFLINGVQVVYTKLLLSALSKYDLQGILDTAESASSNYSAIVTGIFFTLLATPFLIIVSKKFMEHNKHHRIDYELSIVHKTPEEFEINIDTIGKRKNSFVDIYFISYILITLFLSIFYLLAQ